MMHYFRIYRQYSAKAVTLLSAALLSGCISPKPHAWQPPRRELEAVLTEAKGWPQLGTNLYSRVEDGKLPQAISLLQDSAWLPIDRGQVSAFSSTLNSPTDDKLHGYLVRGLSFSSHPEWTSVAFDQSSGRLLVRQATWNGELALPFLWKSQPNALVVFLPRAPASLYPAALLGGDGIVNQGTDHR